MTDISPTHSGATVGEQDYRIDVRDAWKEYEKRGEGLVVLSGLDLRIREGEFLSLVGASGCGKTTLLKAIHGLIPLSSGEIYLSGEQIDGPSPSCAMVFQDDSLLPWRTVRRNVAFGLELKGIPKSERNGVADQFLELVGLAGFGHHYPHELSGGMRQRANLARALCIEPEVLLMDEPFAALDAQTREIMQRELLAIWDKTDTTVVFVTHQIDEAVYLSDRVVVLTARPGRIREDISIHLARPRGLDIKRSPEFLEPVDHIWGLIEDEVVASMQPGEMAG